MDIGYAFFLLFFTFLFYLGPRQDGRNEEILCLLSGAVRQVFKKKKLCFNGKIPIV